MPKAIVMPRINLRKLILMLTLFFSFVTFNLVLYTSYHEQKTLLIDNALESNRVYAEKLADFTDEIIGSMQKKLAFKSKAIVANFHDKAKIRNILNDLLHSSNGFNAIQIINENGIVEATTSSLLLKEGMQLHSDVSKEILRKKAPMISAPYHGTTRQNILAMSYPLFDHQNRYKGYVQGTIYLQETNIIQSTLGEHYHRDGSYIYVIDQQRHLLYHIDKNRLNTVVSSNTAIDAVLSGKFGTTIMTNKEGQIMMAGYAPIPSLGWGIIVQRPLDSSFTRLYELIRLTVEKTLPLLIISIIIILYLSYLIALPLWKLAIHAREMDDKNTKDDLNNIHAWYFEAEQLKESMLYGLKQVDTKIDQLDREAITDPLTGLTNRRGMERQLAEWKDTPYALLLFDIDHFKKINDTFGHDCGDIVLQALATQIRLNFRPKDLLCRLGGDEFAVLMPYTLIPEASDAAYRLKNAIERHQFEHNCSITISVGISHNTFAPDLDSLFTQADTALYQAKNKGRNQVVIADQVDIASSIK